ncbi:MAG TPA: hypothetical protein DD719_00330 [Desulfotomaculum sp.]|nr:hypothetical protein [Desulfotomaculum sp.]
MEDYVKVAKETLKPITELVRLGLFKDEKDALVELIQDQAKNKIHYYEKKIKEMKKKYRVNFQEFKKSIEERKNEEVFEEWDDFIQWESYEEAIRYWTEAKERVKVK